MGGGGGKRVEKSKRKMDCPHHERNSLKWKTAPEADKGDINHIYKEFYLKTHFFLIPEYFPEDTDSLLEGFQQIWVNTARMQALNMSKLQCWQ